jgi:hypothetical protein
MKTKQVVNAIALEIARARREGAKEMRERAANLIACSERPEYACEGPSNQICNACYRALQIRSLPLPGDDE